MGTEYDKFKQRLRGLRQVVDRISWNDHSLTPEKAYASALFAQTAYLVIPEFEVPGHPMAKVIPCTTYRELLASGIRPDLGQLLADAELTQNVFIDITRRVVVVLAATKAVTFIALRGTRPLYVSDWITDLHATRTALTIGSGTDQVRLHSGFFLAITECLPSIEKGLGKASPNAPVYVVGHSLGGCDGCNRIRA